MAGINGWPGIGKVGIGGVGPARRVGLRRRDGGGFGLARADDTAPAPRAAAAHGLGAIDLLGLQEQAGAAAADTATSRHAGLLLDGLARLQHRLLADPDANDGGGGADADLHTLALLCDAAPYAADPALRALAGSIALRVRIELARRQVGAGP